MTGILDPMTGLVVTSLPEPELDPTPEPTAPAGPVDLANATPLYEQLLAEFPFPEIRAPQVRALQAWSNAMNKDKSFAIFELPTGSGKSPLAWTVAAHAAAEPISGFQPGGYILTTQKALQQQYMRDFEAMGMADLRGASNYRCHDYNTDCQTGSLIRQGLKKGGTDPFTCGGCEYKAAKMNFIQSPIGVTSFAYFLSEVQHVHMLKPRSVLIIDEAHNTESQLLGMVEIEITRSRCEQLGCAPPPRIADGAILDARAWVLDQFLPKVMAAVTALEDELEHSVTAQRSVLSKQVANLNQYVSRIGGIQNTETLRDWFCNTDSKTGTLKLRPLTAAAFAQDNLFKMGHRVLFLSATILDPGAFARGLGLNAADGGFCRVESDFPVANRPVHFFPIGSMSYKNKAETTPKLVRFIERILKKHANERGIIHAVSYALAKQIKEYLDSVGMGHRILMPEPGYAQRQACLDLHRDGDQPTVLLSPSMTEGLDLVGDLSRFQILAKVPWPALNDPFIKARMEHDAGWFSWQACLSLVQATGRSVRSREDHAATYILDTDFHSLLARSSHILPKWWLDSIIYH